jgi:hypothetical protein
MGEYRAGPALNLGLACAGFFSCIIALTGLVALYQRFTS